MLLAHLVRLACSRALVRRGHEDRDQDRDDADDDQQFDERKAVPREAALTRVRV